MQNASISFNRAGVFSPYDLKSVCNAPAAELEELLEVGALDEVDALGTDAGIFDPAELVDFFPLFILYDYMLRSEMVRIKKDRQEDWRLCV